MSSTKDFTDQQPRDGDTILHCGHVAGSRTRRPAHWFKFSRAAEFVRPDGSLGSAEWFAACEACFVQHGERVADFPRGDSRWTGDSPVIEKGDN